MESGKSRWGGDRREKGRETDDGQCWGDGVQEEAGENLAVLGWAGMAGQPIFVV